MSHFFIVGFLFAVLPSGSAYADSQQDRARDAYRSGEIMSLSDIRRNVHQDLNGEIIGTQFRAINGGDRPYIYKFKVLSPEGNLTTIDVDARTSKVIKVRGKR